MLQNYGTCILHGCRDDLHADLRSTRSKLAQAEQLARAKESEVEDLLKAYEVLLDHHHRTASDTGTQGCASRALTAGHVTLCIWRCLSAATLARLAALSMIAGLSCDHWTGWLLVGICQQCLPHHALPFNDELRHVSSPSALISAKCCVYLH